MNKTLLTLTLSIIFTVLTISLTAQVVTPIEYNPPADQAAFEQLVGVTLKENDFFQISNVEVTGLFGSGASVSSFTNAQAPLGVEDGLILANAPVDQFADGNTATGVGGNLDLPGNPDLSVMAGFQTRDASNIEFDFVPSREELTLDFVFASEEYCDFVGTVFNDEMGIFLSGPGIAGPFANGAINIAEFTDATGQSLPVNINNINISTNSNLYVDNNVAATLSGGNAACGLVDPANNPFTTASQFDGWTVPLEANYESLQVGETYHLSIVVADGVDAIFGSAVYLVGSTLNAGRPDVTLTADAGPDMTLQCNLPIATLGGDNTSAGDFYEYEWTNFGNVISTEPFVDVENSGQYILNVRNILTSEVVSDTVSVSVNFEFIGLSLSSTGDLTCTNNTTSLEAFTELFYFLDVDLLWETFDGNIISDPTQETIEVDQPGTYTVVVTNPESGCTGTETITVNANEEIPLVSAEVANILTCAQATASIIGSTDVQNAATEWTGPAGNIVSTDLDIVVDTPGAYTLTVINLDNGCASSSSVFVEGDIFEPSAEIFGADVLTCDNSVVNLSALEGFSFVFDWSSNGVNISNQSEVSITAPGEYVLTVTDANNGCTSSSAVIIEADFDEPNIAIDTPDIILNGGQIQLFASVTNSDNVTYSWADPNGNLGIVSGGDTSSPIINVAGDYCLSVTNIENGCTSTECVTVQFATTSTAVADAGPDQSLTCTSSTVTLGGPNTSVGSEFTYMWTDAGNNFLPNTITVDVQNAGTYTLTVTNTLDGTVDTDEVVVGVDENIPSVFLFTSNVGLLDCTNPSVTATAESLTFNISYLWTTTDGVISGDPTLPSIEISTAGTYIVTGTDNVNGCFSSSSVTVIEDFEEPFVQINIPESLTCQTNSVLLDGSASSSGPTIAYEWFDQADASIGTTPSISVSQCGAYTLVLTNANGCTSSASVEVLCDQSLPFVTIAAPPVLELGSSIQLDANGSSVSSGIEYIWTTTDGNIVSGAFTLTPTVDEPGTYCLRVVNNNNFCEVLECVTVMQSSTGTVIADAGFDQELTCVVGSVQIGSMNTSQGTEFCYEWTGPNNFNSIQLQPSVFSPGTYILLVTNKTTGETATDDVDVNVNQEMPSISINTPGVLNCLNTSVELSATVTALGTVEYLWTDPIGSVIGTSADIEVSECGAYTLEVIDQSNGCSNAESVEVNCDMDTPNAIIENPAILNPGMSIQLDGTASSVGVNFSYTWTTTNGNIVSGASTLTPTIDQQGTYCLEVVNLDNGCFSEVCVEVMEDDTVIADAGFVVFTCLNVDSIMLNGSNSSMGSEFEYLWTNSNGDSISTEITAVVVLEIGYTLTVTNTITGMSASDNVIFEEDIVDPFVNVVTTGVIDCNQSTVLINLTTDLDPQMAQYEWEGPGIISATDIEDITVDAAGQYTVVVTNTENGCTTSQLVLVTEDIQGLDISVGGVLIVCEDSLLLDPNQIFQTTDIGALMEGGWEPQPGLSIGTFPLATATQSGTYVFNGINPVNGCNIRIEYPVQLGTPFTIDVGPDQVLTCLQEEVELSVNVEPALDNLLIEWFSPDGNFISQEPTVFVSEDGIYTVNVLDSSSGCFETTEIEVTPDANQPILDIQTTDISCFGADDGMINVAATGGTPPYSFDFPDPNQTGLPAGLYSITLTDDTGCEVIATAEIEEPEQLLLDFEINADDNLVALTTGGVMPYSYLWSTGADSSILENPEFGVPYTLTVTDANGCVETLDILLEPNAVRGIEPEELSVYPNPTNDFVIITQEDIASAMSDIKIVDVQGRVLPLSHAIQDKDNIKLNMHSFTAGVYFIHVIIDNTLYYQKIIVQ